LFVGQYDDPTKATLDTLSAAHMPVMCEPNSAVTSYPNGEWWGPTQVQEMGERREERGERGEGEGREGERGRKMKAGGEKKEI
jgi:hypothetical protein